MSSFLQNEHSAEQGLNEQLLLIKIVSVSVLTHIVMLLGLFLGDLFLPTQMLVLRSGGASVSLGRGKARVSKGASAAVARTGASKDDVPAKDASPTQANTDAPQKVSKDKVMRKTESDKVLPEQTSIKQNQTRKEEAAKSEMKKGAKKEVVEKTVDQSVPAFSELKKNYTNLKKAPKAVKPTPAPEKKELKSHAVKPQELKQVAKEMQPVEPKSVPKAISLEQPKASTTQDENDSSTGGTVSGTTAPTEQLDFALDGEGTEGDMGSSDNIIVGEIARHYRRPPGFDDHEPFIFTFEIRNGKATAIGPRGSEPLVLYSALKNAVLKATFPMNKHTRKIELRIT